MAARTVVVVQARSGSQRLPGKVLMDLAGRPMIEQVLLRAAAGRRVDEVVLATSGEPRDDAVADVAAAAGFRVHRGSEIDVLGRIRDTAKVARADVVVRVTGDCPLLDPAVLDRVVGALIEDPAGADLASNVVRRTYPRGLDVEALHGDVLERIARMATSDAAREHVTWFAYRERPELFVLTSVEDATDHSDRDWSVDTREDLEAVRALYARFGLGERHVGYRELL
jgi:spore coat polysaccharide biosynthesis protein SpsF (cytidylyltransferase family)